MLGACQVEHAGHLGIFQISYNPASFPKRDCLGGSFSDLLPSLRPFSTVQELNSFIDLTEYFARSWKITLAEQVPAWLSVDGFEAYDADEYDPLPTGAAKCKPAEIGRVAATQPLPADTYTVSHRGALVCVRRLSVSLFDPPECEVRDWLSSLAAGPDFRNALPSNWKALN